MWPHTGLLLRNTSLPVPVIGTSPAPNRSSLSDGMSLNHLRVPRDTFADGALTWSRGDRGPEAAPCLRPGALCAAVFTWRCLVDLWWLV